MTPLQQLQKESKLKNSFVDILHGYSQFFFEGRVFYIKHHFYKDEIVAQKIYDEQYEYAREKGVLTEQSAKDFVIGEGLWSENQEQHIEKLLADISVLNDGKRHLKFSSEIKIQNEQID